MKPPVPKTALKKVDETKPVSIKRILLKIGGWILFFGIVSLLLGSPSFYYRFTRGDWNGRYAVCGTESKNPRSTDLEQIVRHPDYWNFQDVEVTGKLSYAPSRKTFHLRDGISMIPLDVSDCQRLETFQKEELIATVKGTIADDVGPLLEVTDLRESVPTWVQVVFNAGFWGTIFLYGVAFAGLFWLIRRFLILIGLMKPRTARPTNEMNEKKAGGVLLSSIFIPFVWVVVNPIVGAGLYISNILSGWRGLRSRKRTVAIIGLTLCVTGLIVMPFVSIGLGAFENPTFNFYSVTAGTSPIKPEPTGKELLEIKPYVNDKMHFSIHPPKGWTPDEKDVKKALIVFRGPEDGSYKDKPFHPELNVGGVPISALEVKNEADAIPAFKKLALKGENFRLLSEEPLSLAGGRMDAELVEFTDTKDGVSRHILALLVAKNDQLYVAGMEAPPEKWDRYDDVVRDSLRTLVVWKGTFADCLKTKKTIFYGVLDCPACTEQKKLFTDGIGRLPYVECQEFENQRQLDVCKEKNIEAYPTWEFSDSSRLVGWQSLKTLSDKTECPLPK